MKRFIHLVLLTLAIHGGNGYASENPHGELKIECETCHITSSWKDVEFSHDGVGFNLSDTHARVNCDQCHDTKKFSEVPGDCRGCHKDVHESRMGPDCGQCHTPQQWEVFDTEEIHARTRFPMLDRHIQVDCRNCHPNLIEGDFALSARDCVDCHEVDYLSTSNPEHVSLGFSTICMECHTPVRWRPAFFASHDIVFPVFSGEHRGVWDLCIDCHPGPEAFSGFSCFRCHSRPEMDNEHSDIEGYIYENQACLGCHPTGEGGEFLDHDPLYFPIFSGSHREKWDACTICHIDPGDWSVFSCVECHEHRRSVTDEDHIEVQDYIYDSQTCYDCHPTGEERLFWKKTRSER